MRDHPANFAFKAARIGAVLLASVAMASCGRSGSLRSSAAVPSTESTTSATVLATTRYTHVVNIWMENKGFSAVIGSKNAPYENQLANTYGLATQFENTAHPSLPNYIAATSGSTQGIVDDGSPAVNARDVTSLFSQLEAAGKSWKSYEESMTQNCQLASAGTYAVKHNPVAYYLPLRQSCQQNDVPFGSLSTGPFVDDVNTGLPSFSFVTPNLINDTHDSSVATGDKWLSQLIPVILDGRDYKAGNTALIISWDETEGGETVQPEIVISPSTHAVKANLPLTHYSRLSAIEQLFGLAQLNPNGDGNAYLRAFGLDGSTTP